MQEDLEKLCSFELEIVPNGSKKVMDWILFTLKSLGFQEKNGSWNNGHFTVGHEFSEGQPYDTLNIYFKSPSFTTTPVIKLLEEGIRRYTEYIPSFSIKQSEGYRNCLELQKKDYTGPIIVKS